MKFTCPERPWVNYDNVTGAQHLVTSVTALWSTDKRSSIVGKSGRLMSVSRAGAFTMTMIAVLWAATPAIACLMPTHQMTQAEHECCLKMAQQCGSSAMPSSHSCCQGHQRETAVSPVSTYAPNRPFALAIVPPMSVVLIDSALTFPISPALEAPPPDSSPGCTSVLRI
jgi:hypothetical protein